MEQVKERCWMELFEKIGDTIVSAGKDVTEKAKELSSVAKLKMDIRSKEDFLQKQYAELGKLYYEAHKEEEVPEQECFASIAQTLGEIQSLKDEILVTQGAVICPQCGAKQPKEHTYCDKCGAHLSIFEE